MLGDADSLALDQMRDVDEQVFEPPVPAKRGRKRKNQDDMVGFLNMLIIKYQMIN